MATKQTSSRSSSTTTNPKKKPKSEAPTPITSVVAKVPAKVAAKPPSHDDIAQRAFSLYQARGGTSGDPLHDWLAAERELTR